MDTNHLDPKKLAAAIRDIAMRIGVLNEDIILVGGQSVLFWAKYFNIDVPDGIKALTEDVDFVANRIDVVDVGEIMATQFDCKLVIASMDESSPNSGKMSIDYPGVGKVNVDFLRMITGVNNDELMRSAYPLEVDPGVVLRIISPPLLLRSKISNIGAHLNKRGAEGLAQGVMAVSIVNQYLKSMVLNDERPPYTEFEDVIRFARSDPALYANKFCGIDVMKSLPLDALPPDDPFLVKRYPVAMQQIQIKRDKFDDLIERMEKYDHAPASSRFNM